LILFMVYHCYARKGSENRGSGVCRTIIYHNHWQPELEAFLDDPPHLRPMVIGGNDNDIAKRNGHEMRDPGSRGVHLRGILLSIPPQGSVKTFRKLGSFMMVSINLFVIL
jgi:hypothetical protein